MKFRPGAQLAIEYMIKTPHPGYANLSVVDTKTNKPIGAPLKVFSKFGETVDNADELDWSFNMSDTGRKCSTPGNCVLQFWWRSDEYVEPSRGVRGWPTNNTVIGPTRPLHPA